MTNLYLFDEKLRYFNKVDINNVKLTRLKRLTNTESVKVSDLG